MQDALAEFDSDSASVWLRPKPPIDHYCLQVQKLYYKHQPPSVRPDRVIAYGLRLIDAQGNYDGALVARIRELQQSAYDRGDEGAAAKAVVAMLPAKRPALPFLQMTPDLVALYGAELELPHDVMRLWSLLVSAQAQFLLAETGKTPQLALRLLKAAFSTHELDEETAHELLTTPVSRYFREADADWVKAGLAKRAEQFRQEQDIALGWRP